MNVYIMGSFRDQQTGLYILEAFKKQGHDVLGTDIRAILHDLGPEKAQKVILEEAQSIKFTPDVIVVLKGLEAKLSTLQA